MRVGCSEEDPGELGEEGGAGEEDITQEWGPLTAIRRKGTTGVSVVR